MSNIDLTANQTPEAPKAEETALAKRDSGLMLGDKIPEYGDIILPRLNIVQGVGNLKDLFPQGAIVHAQATVLFSPPVIDKKTGNVTTPGTKPLILTVLGFRPTRYAEKVTGGARGLIVDTEAQVRAAGGTLDYKEWDLKKASGMKRFEPLVDAMVAIERPEHIQDDGAIFSFPVGEKNYALALWGMKGTAYTAAAKRVFFTQRAMGCLKLGGYPSYSFAVSTRMESYATGNSCWIPVVVPSARNPQVFIDFATSVLKAPTKEAEEAGEE